MPALIEIIYGTADRDLFDHESSVGHDTWRHADDHLYTMVDSFDSSDHDCTADAVTELLDAGYTTKDGSHYVGPPMTYTNGDPTGSYCAAVIVKNATDGMYGLPFDI